VTRDAYIFSLDFTVDDFFFRNEPHADADVMSTKHTLTEKDVVSAFEEDGYDAYNNWDLSQVSSSGSLFRIFEW